MNDTTFFIKVFKAGEVSSYEITEATSSTQLFKLIDSCIENGEGFVVFEAICLMDRS